MFQMLIHSWEVLKKRWKLFLLTFIASLTLASIDYCFPTKTFRASFIAAPYYETATDVSIKVKELASAVNAGNQKYINNYLDSSLNVSDLENAQGKIKWNHSDYTYKHVKVVFSADVMFSKDLEKWDKALLNFYTENSNDTNCYYRGREVVKERLRLLTKDQYQYDISAKNDSDYILKITRGYMERDSMMINDSNMFELVLARYIGEYKNSITVNPVTNLSESYNLSEFVQFPLRRFLVIAFSPIFIGLFLFAAFREYKSL